MEGRNSISFGINNLPQISQRFTKHGPNSSNDINAYSPRSRISSPLNTQSENYDQFEEVTQASVNFVRKADSSIKPLMIADSSPRLNKRDEGASHNFKSFNMVGNIPFQFIKETPTDKELLSQNIFRSRT